MNKTITFILAFFFAITASAQVSNEDLDVKYASSLLPAGTEVPDMLVDTTINLRLSDMRGHYVVLHFWASWCPDCRKDIPEMEKLDKRYDCFEKKGNEVTFVHISYDGDTARMNRYLSEHALNGYRLCQGRKFHDTETDPQGRVALSTVMIDKLKKALNHLDLSKLDPNAPKAVELPEFQGGTDALMNYLVQNVHYPTKAMEMGLQSKVRVSFVVDTLGRISDLKIKENNLSAVRKAPISKLNPEERQRTAKECATLFANEAKRVVRSMPAWKPARSFGKKTKVSFMLPITFRL